MDRANLAAFALALCLLPGGGWALPWEIEDGTPEMENFSLSDGRLPQSAKKFAYEDYKHFVVGGMQDGWDPTFYSFHWQNHFIETIKVWQGSGGTPIRGIAIKFRGSPVWGKFGSTEGEAVAGVTFWPGDRLKRLVIWNNTDGLEIPGRIELETTRGSSIDVGSGRDAYHYQVEGQLLSRVEVTSHIIHEGNGSVITGIRPVVWQPIESLELRDMRYIPELKNMRPFMQAKKSWTLQECNAASVPMNVQETQLGDAYATGQSACFWNSLERSFGMSANVTAGVPGLTSGESASGESGWHWEVTRARSSKNCDNEEMNERDPVTTKPHVIPPHTQMQFDYRQYGGTAFARYQGSMRVHFKHNVVPPLDLPMSGMYKGVSYTPVVTVAKEVPVTTCGTPNTPAPPPRCWWYWWCLRAQSVGGSTTHETSPRRNESAQLILP